MGPQRSVILVCGALVGLGLAAACAKGDAEDLPFGVRPADGGTEDAKGVKLPGGDDDDDDDSTPPPGDDDDDSVGKPTDGGAPKGDAGSDGGTTTPPGGVSAACQAVIANAKWDFESGDQGWTHKVSDGADQQASWPFDPWSRGTATKIACPAGSCFAGERTQNYAQCSRGELLSPSVDLSACVGANVTLTFAHAYAFWAGTFSGATYFDGGIVELSNNSGATWSVPAATYPGTLKILKDRGSAQCVSATYHADAKQGFTGSQPAAAEFSITVPAAMITAKTRIRFSTAAGVSTNAVGHYRENTESGWRIDNVRFTATAP